jgi:hypothetical protein
VVVLGESGEGDADADGVEDDPLTPAEHDGRVLATILVVCKLARLRGGGGGGGEGCLPQIIAENAQEQTVGLATGVGLSHRPSLLPSPPPEAAAAAEEVGNEAFFPTFVNPREVTARALVMALAYPEVLPALEALLRPGDPEISFLKPSDVGLVPSTGRSGSRGGAPVSLSVTLSFGAVQRVVRAACGGRGHCIGFEEGGEMRLCPRRSEKVVWTGRHRLIVMARNMRQAES